jgi:phosphatidylinositol glycan class M
MKKMAQKFTNEASSVYIIVLAMLLRVAFFLFGKYQDEHMEVKYTDIDYLVFSDASAYVWHQGSPYMRETYRYTPLLSWLLLPNNVWYDFGKWLFIVCDLITGVIIVKLLEIANLQGIKKYIFSSIWLLNPMVITISTRGSSESVLTVFVMFFVYFLLHRDVVTCAIFCGIAVHFKIYPIIYVPTTILFLTPYTEVKHLLKKPTQLINDATVTFAFCFSITFITLGAIMYILYGHEFLEHSYIYHLTRTDHRHNFSVYNISLYFTNAIPEGVDFTKLAFLPQMIISAVLIPFVFTKKSLCDTLFLQTFAFVTFNKVITSQYFIWFLIFLPLYLRNSSLVSSQKVKGIVCLILWIVTQAGWLFFAYKLEFLGESTFFAQMMTSSISFFLSNIYLLGVFMDDIMLKTTDSKSFI